MTNNKIRIIYLLGAGRSGTTLIATILNSHPRIETIGEMHQFYEYLQHNKKCSCGEIFTNCEYWSSIINEVDLDELQIKSNETIVRVKEGHRNILKLLFSKNYDREYLDTQIPVFEKLKEKKNEITWFLDSSKYIARYLLLKRSNRLRIKGIYVVRDVRGVINSFNKKVQTPKKPLSSIIYYILINFFGQLVCSIDKEIIKIRYEDFVNKPEEVSKRIITHVFSEKQEFKLKQEFLMPHIVGGNRMKTNNQISIKKDLKWKESITRSKQVFYYFLTLPLMLINKYKP